MSVNSIQIIGEDKATLENYIPEKSKVVSGNPSQLIWHCFDSEDETFGAGIWQGEVGSHQVSYTEDEVCFLLQGKVIIHDSEGGELTLNKGDMFAIPAGFSGIWETVEQAKKLYVIYEK